MKPLLAVLPLALALALGACVPSPPPPPAAPPIDPAALRRELALLPGASVGAGEPLSLSYPGEALFAAGAALPLPGGTAVLDPLARLLVAHPQLRWTGTVRAAGGVTADYDAALAQKRLELLERYFRNRGVGGDRLTLSATAGEGAPLELTVTPAQPPPSPPSSPAEKR
jgi:hypothetical protein